MIDLNEIDKKIKCIGKDLVICENFCEGILNEPKKGVLPRCLFLEIDKRNIDSNGVVFVGINPGKTKNNEDQFYINNGVNYESLVTYWNKRIKKVSYYQRLKNLATQLGFDGPILWTELVKCENSSGNLPPLQTFRTCTNKYLRRELLSIPEEWFIFAIGRETYTALSYLYPERTIIGVPHPTNSRGNFRWLFDKDSILKSNIKEEFSNVEGKTLWLASKK